MPVKKVGWRDLAKGVRYMVPPLLDIQRGNLLRLAGLRPASKQSIGKVIEYWARRTPHNIAFRFEAQQWTYAQFNASLISEIKVRRASLEFDERNHQRVEELYTKKAIPLHHKDEAQTDAAKSRWLLTKAEEDKRLAALEYARASAVLKRKTVRSPISGVVIARHKSTGEYIEDQAIITVAQLHPLRVDVIAEKLIDRAEGISPGHEKISAANNALEIAQFDYAIENINVPIEPDVDSPKVAAVAPQTGDEKKRGDAFVQQISGEN